MQAMSPNKSVYLVQALLLLATWPQGVPQGSTVNDHAWMYVGMATHMAQCLGLHRSFLSNEYHSQMDATEEIHREWVRTWIGCFIVGQLYDPLNILLTIAFPQHWVSTPSSQKISPSKTPKPFSPPTPLQPTILLSPSS